MKNQVYDLSWIASKPFTVIVGLDEQQLSAKIGEMALKSQSIGEINDASDEIPEPKPAFPDDELLEAIFPSKAITNSDNRAKYLQWYCIWLKRQIELLPKIVTSHVQNATDLLLPVAYLLKGGRSIDGIANLILAEFITGERDETAKHIAKTLAFAIVGWLTMLYAPAINTCPPGYFAVVDAFDGHTFPAFLQLRQDATRTRLPLCDFLVGFGLVLPTRNICISDDKDICATFEKTSIVKPNEFNAGLLVKFGKIKIEWTEVLSAHMEFDAEAETLFLYRYPSFCLASIAQGGGESSCLMNVSHDTKNESAIHSCASSKDDGKWASKEDVTQFLIEVLLSYRLLFGQDSASRRIYSKINPFKDTKSSLQDPLLEQLCTLQSSSLPSILNDIDMKERDYYRHKRDFPILRSRIAILQADLAEWTPRGWSDIWNDKRNSAGWYTFWTVLIIGGLGLILAIIQVALQAAQIAGAGAG